MIDVDTLTDEDIEEITAEHEWEQDPDEPELEEFSGFCPYCGEEMQCIESRYKDGCEVGLYMCMKCDEDAAHNGSVWVYEDGPYRDHVCENMYE